MASRAANSSGVGSFSYSFPLGGGALPFAGAAAIRAAFSSSVSSL